MLGSDPILITGVFRSGTTLISQILNNHPEISITYDSVNFMRFCYGCYDPIQNKENVKKLISEVYDRVNVRWGLSFNKKAVLDKVFEDNVTYASIYNVLMSDLLLNDDKAKIWGEKTTLVWSQIPNFFDMFPNGRVIHIIRDPRAVLASWKKMTHAPGYDYLDAVFNCIDSMKKSNIYKNTYTDENYISVRFETLVKYPESVAREVCQKLNIKFYDELTNPKQFLNKSGERWKGNSMFENNLTEISTSSLDTWKKKLESWEIAFIQKLMPNLLSDYGYEMENINKVNFDTIIDKILSSDLVSHGALNLLLTKNGLERFPLNPLKPESWGNN